MIVALPKESIVAVIGAGAMGAGIAQIAAVHGHRVQLHDTRMGAGDAAKRGIGEALDKLVAKGRLARVEADAVLARIATVVALPDVCVAQLVVEAIIEDLAAKRELFERVENVVDPQCILASNTSSLSITALGAQAKRPDRIVGMHFFNPAPLMPLVEVVTGLATSPAVAETVHATALAWGKTPVYASSTPGFIVNRCARPYYAEGLRLLNERAADVATLDAVFREAGGFRMGPFELIDLIGLDVNLAVTKSIWAAYFHDPRYAPSVLQEERVSAGFLGRKSGRGFYDYTPGIAKPLPSEEAKEIAPARVTVHGELGIAAPLAERIAVGGVAVERARADSRFPAGAIHVPGSGGGAWLALTDGRTATKRVGDCGVRDLVLFDLALDYRAATRLAVARADTCSDTASAAAVGALQAAGVNVSRLDDVAGLAVLRTVAMLANEAADAVVQGVAAPEAIDIAMLKGVNYPRGPVAWADAIGAATIRDALGNLAAHYGEDRYRISPLIARRAATGGGISVGEHHPALTEADARALAGRVAAAMYSRDGASRGLGIAVAEVGAGRAELTMSVRADMLNGHEICHGGFIFTLADSAFAYACNSYNLNTVASGCSIDFVAPAREGDVLTARALERALAGRTGVYDVEVANQRGEVVALFRGKSYRIKGHLIQA